MWNKLKMRLRRKRVFKPQAHITWSLGDTQELNAFFVGNDSGKKVLTVLFDVAFNAVVGARCSSEYVNGMLDTLSYLEQLSAVKNSREKEKDQDEE